MSVLTQDNQKATAWLSYIAYTDPDKDGDPQQAADIVQNLDDLMQHDFNGPYTLVWGPASVGGVLVYVVQDKNGTFLVACRGTIKFELDNIINWLSNIIYDLDSLFTDAWQYQASSNIGNGALVTDGMSRAFSDIIVQPGNDLIQGNGTTNTLLTFLQTHLQQTTSAVLVTGHSLGGALANLIAVYLAYECQSTLPNTAFVPFTFAAPTVTNDIFQSQVFNVYCKTSFQLVNTQDVIPMSWNNLDGVAEAYTPADWLFPRLYWDEPPLWAIVTLAAKLISVAGYNFTPVAEPKTFAGTVDPGLSWSSDVLAQHSLDGFYFQALGLTPPPAGKIPSIPSIKPEDVKVPQRMAVGIKRKTKEKLQITLVS